MKNRNNNSGKLSVLKKIGYGLGETGSQFSFTLISSYLTVFYSDVVGLTTGAISSIMLAVRVWDALNDPMFGAIAENTHTKLGRFRPYILLGAPVLCLFNCLTFLKLDISYGWKVVWCVFTYIGCGMAYTVVNISIGCLANSMTAVNKERISLNAYKGVFGSIAALLINAVTMPIILYFGNGSTSSDRGYFMAALIFSAIALVCFWICGGSSVEVIKPRLEQRRQSVLKALIRSFRYIAEDKNVVLLLLAMFTFLTGLFGRLGIMAYYFIYILENPLLLAIYGIVMSVGAMVANFYGPFLLNRIDKKWVGVLSALFQTGCCIAFFVFGEMKAEIAVVIVGFLYGATNIVPLVSTGMGAEVIDDNWLRTGIRSDGIIYSCISFSTKFGNAIGGSIGIIALGAVGFVANSEMSATTLTHMNMVINFEPIVLFLISAVLFALNGMTNKKSRENEKKIQDMMKTKEKEQTDEI